MGPLLFNIFLADLFLTFSNKEIANYADDTTPYAVSGNIDDLIASLKKSNDLLQWFDDIFVKSNPEKYHLLLSSCGKIKMEKVDFEIDKNTFFNKCLTAHDQLWAIIEAVVSLTRC